MERFERSTTISSKEDSIAEQDCGNKEGNVTGTMFEGGSKEEKRPRGAVEVR